MSGNHRSARSGASLAKAFDAFAAGRLDEAQSLARDATEAAPAQEDGWRILAAVAQRQGRLADAAEALRAGIGHNAQSPALFTMLGLLLRDIGRFADAETALRHALTLSPAQEDAALNLGNLLARQNRMHEAEAVFRDAAKAMPAQPRFPLQLGRVLLTLGRADLAREALTQAAGQARAALAEGGERPQDPSLYVEIAAQLAGLLFALGDRLQALDYFYDAVQLGEDEAVRAQFAECVATIPFMAPEPLLKPLLERALAEAWVPPETLMRQGANQLLLDPAFSAPAERIEMIADEAEAPLLNPDVAAVSGDPLLRTMLQAAVIPEASLERVLRHLRRMLLVARRDPQGPGARGSDGLLAFAVALANQSYLTDYAWAVTADEDALVETLTARVCASADAGEPIAMSDLAALACYRALHSLGCAGALLERSWPPAIEPVIRQQLREPAREAELRDTIQAVTAIDDATSRDVRAQYEENPFPRWSRAAVRTQPVALGQWLQSVFPNLPADRFPAPAADEPLAVLVAGCGTGQEVIGSATRFANSEVLAVDLSLTSLAYALRKTEEAGIANVTYAQADILELDGIGRQFDVVECAGVLHHLADPLAGWQVLTRLTRPGGYMLMALYSQQGRRDLDPARAFVAERGYGVSAEELRRFRADVLALPSDSPARRLVVQRDDFYNLSMLRDLVFHVQERRFTIAEIGTMLDRLGLELCGFAVDPETRLQFAERFGPRPDFASLDDWEALEEERPDTFSAMYHFLVRKPA